MFRVKNLTLEQEKQIIYYYQDKKMGQIAVSKKVLGVSNPNIVKNTRKDFVITGASKEPYEWDVEGILTAKEVTEAIANRETYLATMKQRQDEYRAAQQQTNSPNVVTTSNNGFNF